METPNSSQSRKIILIKGNYVSNSKIKKDLNILIVLFALFLLLTSFILLFYPDNPIVWMMVIAIAIAGIFLFLAFFHKTYEKAVEKINPDKILFLVYFLLLINMIAGTKYYSIEWALLGFAIAGVILYDSKIDSRFMIFPALLLLGYVPFLLIGKQNSLAETIAIYVYYFLVSGVILQILENSRQMQVSLDFEQWIKKIISHRYLGETMIFTGIAAILIIILNRFKTIELLKQTFIYLFFILIILYFLSRIKIQNDN
jgi:hypothetical protein